MLELVEVTAGYQQDIDILQDISIKVKKGQTTGVIGPNGAGKSTIFKAIFGFLSPKSGRIILDEEVINGIRPSEAPRKGISYVPQGRNTFPQLTVEENLLLGAWISRKDKEKTESRLEEIFSIFPNLSKKHNSKATYLSGGESRMLELAKGLMIDPKIMLIDEPSAGLAPILSEEMYAHINKIRSKGTTILLIDQNIPKAIELSEYVYMISSGRNVAEGARAFFEKNLGQIIKDEVLG